MTLSDALAAKLAALTRERPPAFERAVRRAVRYGEWWRLDPADREMVREWQAAVKAPGGQIIPTKDETADGILAARRLEAN